MCLCVCACVSARGREGRVNEDEREREGGERAIEREPEKEGDTHYNQALMLAELVLLFSFEAVRERGRVFLC